jgi:phage shock protein E
MNSRVIIDVREPDEYAEGHYKDAINIPLSSIAENQDLRAVDKSQEIIVYCRSGGRSQMAEQFLRSQGFVNVVNGINQQNLEATLS